MENEERKEAMLKALKFLAGLFLWSILMVGWFTILNEVGYPLAAKSGIIKFLLAVLTLAGAIGFLYLVFLFFAKAEEKLEYHCEECGRPVLRFLCEECRKPVIDSHELSLTLNEVVCSHRRDRNLNNGNFAEKILDAVLEQLKKDKWRIVRVPR